MSSLENCINRLSYVLVELDDIAQGIRSDFIGIGQDLCSDCIGVIAEKYSKALTRLYNVDLSKYEE